MKNIETGDSKWLEVAKALRSGLGAGARTDVWFALATALPNAPKRVLKIIKDSVPINDFADSFPLRNICTIPFIEGEIEVEKKYLRRTEQALKNVQNPELEDVRWECLRVIHYLQEKIYLYEEKIKEKQIRWSVNHEDKVKKIRSINDPKDIFK